MVKFVVIKAVNEVYDAVFQTADIERIKDMKDFNWHFADNEVSYKVFPCDVFNMKFYRLEP